MSDDDLAWRLGTRFPGADYRVFKTYFVEGEHPRGLRMRFSVIDAGDWVNVIALTRDEHVVLLRQYRVGAGKVCLEIPGGMVDPGEDPRTAAARELAEETGYTSSRWELLGTVAPNPAIMNNHLHTFLALDAERTVETKLDTNEVLTVSTLPLRDIKPLLRDGTIDHALVIAAFGHLAFRQENGGGPHF